MTKDAKEINMPRLGSSKAHLQDCGWSCLVSDVWLFTKDEIQCFNDIITALFHFTFILLYYLL